MEHEAATHCHNCGAAVSGHYCAACGQETKLHVASAGEFIHEFIGHYVALEGRLWQSLRFLLLRPGFLTAEYIAGRRKRYVEPLRLYLTFSLLFFALFKYGGFEVARMDSLSDTRPAMVKVESGDDVSATFSGLTPAMRSKAEGFVKKSPEEQSKVLASSFFSYGPYAIFLLMPLFALYLKLLYLGSGKRYGEHLLFALHANAFAYIALGAAIVMPWNFARFLVVLWLAAYLPLAMRRVYGGGMAGTLLRWAVLALLHVLSIAAAILAAFGLAVIA